MDSVTHVLFGAAVGQATLGEKEGSKAMLWGAVAQTIPDLDVFASLFMDPVSYLSIHRGFTHSVFFPFLAAPLLSWLILRLHGRGNLNAGYREWTAAMFIALMLHPLMDLCTGYGTQLFSPISDHGFELNTIFIVDPLFTLPLIFGVFYSWRSNRHGRSDTKPARIALAVSLSYLILTGALKMSATPQIHSELERHSIEYHQLHISPTPFNSVYWRALAETETGYMEGYLSLFDRSGEMDFQFIPRNEEKLAPYRNTKAYKELMWFSKGYYSVTEEDGTMYFNDLRFGTLPVWAVEPEQFVFRFRLMNPSADSLEFKMDNQMPEVTSEEFRRFGWKIFGQ